MMSMAQNDLEALAGYANLAIDQLSNALEAARGIRDRAQAANARGLREDDNTEIRRYLRFLTTGLGSAGRVLPDLSRKAEEVASPSESTQLRSLQSVEPNWQCPTCRKWVKVTEAVHLKSGHEVVDAPRPLHRIADEIIKTWRKPLPYETGTQIAVSPEAAPYVRAMQHLGSVTDSYGSDDAEEIILKFLGNARAWHGDDAKRIKAELRQILANAKKATRR
jgi:hypothetical protein